MTKPTATFEQVAPLADTLTPQDKMRLITHLTLDLQRQYLEQLPEAPEWPPDYFERTYGSLADDPIERPPQGDYEDRDEIE
jgi:hypothetical protein